MSAPPAPSPKSSTPLVFRPSMSVGTSPGIDRGRTEAPERDALPGVARVLEAIARVEDAYMYWLAITPPIERHFFETKNGAIFRIRVETRDRLDDILNEGLAALGKFDFQIVADILAAAAMMPQMQGRWTQGDLSGPRRLKAFLQRIAERFELEEGTTAAKFVTVLVTMSSTETELQRNTTAAMELISQLRAEGTLSNPPDLQKLIRAVRDRQEALEFALLMAAQRDPAQEAADPFQ